MLSPAQFLGQPLPALLDALARADPVALLGDDQGRVLPYSAESLTVTHIEPATLRPASMMAATLADADLPRHHPDVDVPGVALEAFLGGGGQGWVYAARVKDTGHVVAVKVLRSDVGAGPGTAAHEAFVCKKIHHPNVLRVFQACPAGAFWVVIMELIQGGELHTEHLTPEQLPSCLAQVADALRALGHHQVVHCDVKPANILLRRLDRSPVLVDFGVARDLTEMDEPRGIFGTPYFMAPEAFGQAAPTPAWDAYALGVTAALLLGVHRDYRALDAIREDKLSGEFDRSLLAGLQDQPHTELAGWAADLLDREPQRRLAALEAARRWQTAA